MLPGLKTASAQAASQSSMSWLKTCSRYAHVGKSGDYHDEGWRNLHHVGQASHAACQSPLGKIAPWCDQMCPPWIILWTYTYDHHTRYQIHHDLYLFRGICHCYGACIGLPRNHLVDDLPLQANGASRYPGASQCKGKNSTAYHAYELSGFGIFWTSMRGLLDSDILEVSRHMYMHNLSQQQGAQLYSSQSYGSQ